MAIGLTDRLFRKREYVMNKLITITGALILIASTAPAALANDLISRSNYSNELDRCVAEIDTMLGAGIERRLRHLVTDIRKDRSRYTFVIETQAVAGDITTEIATTECIANRFNEETLVSAIEVAPASRVSQL